MKTEKLIVPLPAKLAYTGFMAILVPVYLRNYGPANFLYFCDVALLLTLAGIWLEKPLLISMSAVGILAPQILWLVDFFANFAGAPLTGVTDYMFDAKKSLFLRSLSLFHGWLPLLLLYLVWRNGYDRRALRAWTMLAWLVILISYFFMPGPRPNPGNAAVNINYVYGLSDSVAQTWMQPLLWVGLMMIVLPIALFLPTHVALAWWKGKN